MNRDTTGASSHHYETLLQNRRRSLHEARDDVGAPLRKAAAYGMIVAIDMLKVPHSL